MKLIPDLTFNGNCAEAIEYYRDIFKGEIIQVVTYEDAIIECPEEIYDKIFTAVLVIAKNTLYFSDAIDKTIADKQGKMAIMIEFFNEEEMRGLFENLSKDGNVIENIKETNWGSLYGTVEDKFGFIWNFNYEMCVL